MRSLCRWAAEAGFRYHHAAEDYVMMTLQIEKGAYIPPHATHYIGAGGVVISEDRKLLVVSERHQIRPRSGPSYKLPGGALVQGEHLADGVVREVLEETGVRTRFEAVVCLRHWHGYRYGKSRHLFRVQAVAVEHGDHDAGGGAGGGAVDGR